MIRYTCTYKKAFRWLLATLHQRITLCSLVHCSSVKGQQQGQGKPTEGRKHASLPKEAVNIMLNWLREHQDKPYPNDDEKGMLIKQTGLSITQINYWFTNARRRLLPKWRGEDM